MVAVGDNVGPDDFKVGDHVGYLMEASQAEFTAVDASKNVKVLRPHLNGYVATKQELAEYAGELLDLVRLKKVSVRLHKTYPLADARQAHMVSSTLPCHPLGRRQPGC